MTNKINKLVNGEPVLNQWLHDEKNELLIYSVDEEKMILYTLDLKEVLFMAIDSKFFVDYIQLMNILNQLPEIIENVK